jgi:hypothetical protein
VVDCFSTIQLELALGLEISRRVDGDTPAWCAHALENTRPLAWPPINRYSPLVAEDAGGLTISDPPTQPEVQALRDKCEELADDVRTLSTLVHALRGALVLTGVVKGGV